jgi:hypothetical protein
MAFSKLITLSRCAAALASAFLCACATSNPPPAASQTQQPAANAAFPAKPISYGAWDDKVPAATNLAVLHIETQTKRVVAGKMHVTILNGLAIPHGTILTNGARAKWEWVLLPAGESIVSCHYEEYYNGVYRYNDVSGILHFQPGQIYRLTFSDKSDNDPIVIPEKIGPADFGPTSPYFPVSRDAVPAANP